MTRPQANEILNVCLIGHGDSGKTTLADHLLFRMKAVQRCGSVKEKSSVFDHDELAREKQHSIDLSLAHARWDGRWINIIDTPGYPDYLGEAIAGLTAADTAILCVNAHNGVQVNTRRTFELARQMGKTILIAVTKCDFHDLDFVEVLQNLRSKLHERCIPIILPIGIGPHLSGTVDVLHSKGKASEQAKRFFEQFVEAAVEVDDAAMTQYLEGETLSDDTLRSVIKRAIEQQIVFPVVFCSAERGFGDQDLLNAIVRHAPHAAQKSSRTLRDNSGAEIQAHVGTDGPFYGHVFKVHIDKHVGKVAYVRVVSGTVKTGDTLHHSHGTRKDKAGHIVLPMGRETQPSDIASSGDIVAFTKLESLHTGDTISSEESPRSFAPIPFPKPMAQVAVRPKARGDESKISEALHKLTDEYATFKIHREDATHEMIASGLSALHLETMFRRLKDRFGIEIESHPARVPYRECVTSTAEGHYRHKKQSGGRGQFGEVFLRVSPAGPGSGLVFHWDVVGGTIPSNFKPAIEKGIREKMVQGVIAGYPVEDIQVSVYDGKFHDVDSSEAAFKIAGGRAFSEAFKKARPVLLEPMVDAEIVVPGACMGDVSGDLNTRRGHISGMESEGVFQIIRARIPRSELAEYPRVLTSITSGEGSYSYVEAGYEQVPHTVQSNLISAYRPHEDDEG